VACAVAACPVLDAGVPLLAEPELVELIMPPVEPTLPVTGPDPPSEVAGSLLQARRRSALPTLRQEPLPMPSIAVTALRSRIIDTLM